MRTAAFFSFVVLCGYIDAQDLAALGAAAKKLRRAHPFSVSGSIGSNTTLFETDQVNSRRPAFSYGINGQINIVLFERVQVPFSFSYSEQESRLSNGLERYMKPFNIIGVSPRYKWFTLHAGFRSLLFSEYSLSSAMWLGAGLEVKPDSGLLSGAVCYGKIVSASDHKEGAYQRWCGAGKLRVGSRRNFCELVYMRITDDPFPQTGVSPETAPADNIVSGLQAAYAVSRRLKFTADACWSFYTRNTTDPLRPVSGFSFINTLYDTRLSSRLNVMAGFSTEYQSGQNTYMLKYRRIDPGYISLGSNYLINDLEELSASAGLRLSKFRCVLNGSAGFQRNNLDHLNAATSRRFVSALNLSWNPSPAVTLNAGYSGFSSVARTLRQDIDAADSLRFVQITSSATGGFSYAHKSALFSGALSLDLAFQQSLATRESKANILSGTIAYRYHRVRGGWSLQSGGTFNRITDPNGENFQFGPIAGFQKTFWKQRFRTQANISWQRVNIGNGVSGNAITYACSATFRHGRSHMFKADANFVQRLGKGREVRCTFSYQYSFEAFKSRRAK